MSDLLYLEDSYLKKFNTKVKKVNKGKFVVLEETAFYPNSGGQPHDTGFIQKGDEKFKVVYVGKFDGEISHEVEDRGLEEGDEVCCVIDWERRYSLMKMHTAAHVLSSVVHNETGAKITGNQLDVDRSRIDFSLDNFDKDKMGKYVAEASRILEKGLDVKTYTLPREEAMKIPSVVKLANALPPNIKELRIVEIGDVDTQADGGTHVKNTSEVGKIELVKVQNKGKNNRRIYYTLKE